MKQLFITAIISLSLALCSCSGNNATKESNIMNAAGSPIATTSISTSDDSFSCKLDGKVFSESGSTGNIYVRRLMLIKLSTQRYFCDDEILNKRI